MRLIFRNLFQTPAWDNSGRLKNLASRASDAAACTVVGVSARSTERALRLFCDAFDIPDEQMFCLRPTDAIHDIYRAMVPVAAKRDDMEYERLAWNLEDAIGRALTTDESKSLTTLEDLIRFVHENVAGPWRLQLEFPVIAFSRAGWWKEAATADDLCDASPDDPLDEWQGLEILDSGGRRFTAVRAFREWPRTRVGHWLCKFSGNSIGVGFDLSAPEHVSVAELRQRIIAVEPLPEASIFTSHRQLLEHLCS